MERKTLLVEEISLVWRKFCELHNDLYMETCKEYQLLLAGQTESLGEHLKNKTHIINEIRDMELVRKDLIANLNGLIKSKEITNTSGLLDYLQIEKSNEDQGKNLKKYNDLLVNMIEKIKYQNKKNKMFLNKAIHNLRTIREDISGQRLLSTYDSKGKEQRRLALK